MFRYRRGFPNTIEAPPKYSVWSSTFQQISRNAKSPASSIASASKSDHTNPNLAHPPIPRTIEPHIQEMLFFTLLALLLAGLSDLAKLANFASAKRLAGHGLHYLVLQRDGQVFGVGNNNQGQLGLNTNATTNEDAHHIF
ncbi:hypothetical protein BASA81_003591 [Batrachochytrium salamandrivorans]|nr:hypothetical protein BASA81_003591 [Batrachochytrium salamandrivorans]